VTEAEEIPDPAQAVAVAYVHTDEVLYSWHHSMTQLLAYDAANTGRIWTGGYVAIRCGTDGLADARNKAVAEFLADSAAAWLWWIDTDMGFAPDTVDRLVEAADPAERPIVGALCFANRETENDGMGGRRAIAAPVVLDWKTIDGESGYDVRWDYPRDTVTRCDGTGMACVLIHRTVFERVAAEFGPNWYSRARNPSTNQMISEDLSFCVRAAALSIPIHVHTGVSTTHAKRIWLSEEDYWRQRAINAPAPVEPAVPAERTWTVPRYAIIPTHNRPARLLALVTALGPQCDVIFVMDNASDPAVNVDKLSTAAPQATVMVGHDAEQPPHLSRFWNEMLDGCWSIAKERGEDHWDVAILNDDAIVPAGWYDACSNALRAHPTAVIAHTTPTRPALLTELGNDPGNRMTPHAFVIRGEVGLRADESMRWWFFDSDLDQRARLAGGVLSVNGPRVVNSLANTTTRGVLAEQAEKDRATFEAKWSA
jgi:GT2 family glycosyltransferase